MASQKVAGTENEIRVYPNLNSEGASGLYWIPGPELKMGSDQNIRFNYGGNLEDGFEGSSSITSGF